MAVPFQANNPEVVLGLVGGAGCGKDTVAAVFEEHGFTHQSSSDILREEVTARGMAITRAAQTMIANEIRNTQGKAYLVTQAIARARQRSSIEGPVVVSGIYAPAEGAFIQGIGGYIVAVAGTDSDTIQDRFNRVSGRSSGPRDDMTFQEFIDADIRENSGASDAEANIAALSSLANFQITHDGTRPTILPQVTAILTSIRGAR